LSIMVAAVKHPLAHARGSEMASNGGFHTGSCSQSNGPLGGPSSCHPQSGWQLIEKEC
jgi:hypothetical protein